MAAAAATIAGENRIAFMTGLVNPLVILESVHILPAPITLHLGAANPTLLQGCIDLSPPFQAGFIPL